MMRRKSLNIMSGAAVVLMSLFLSACSKISESEPGAKFRGPGSGVAESEIVAQDSSLESQEAPLPLPEKLCEGIIYLIPIGEVSDRLLNDMAQNIEARLRHPCKTEKPPVDFSSAYDSANDRYNAKAIVKEMLDKIYLPEALCLIGITEKGIYAGSSDSLLNRYALQKGTGTVSTYSLQGGRFSKVQYNKLLERVLKYVNRIIYWSLEMKECSHPDCGVQGTENLSNLDSLDLDLCNKCKKQLFNPSFIYNRMAVRAQESDAYSEAEKYLKKALEIEPEDGDTLRKLGELYHYDLKNHEQGEVYFLKAIKVFEKSGDKKKLCKSYHRLGWVYCEYQFDRGKGGYKDKAMACFEKTLALSKEVDSEWDDKEWYEHAGLMGLAAVYNDMIGDHEKALELKLKALEICKKNDWTEHYMVCMGSIGNSYMDLGQNDKAIEYLKERLSYCEEKKDLDGMNWTYGKLGVAYSGMGKYEEAYQFSKKAVETMEKMRSKLDVDKYKIDALGGRWKLGYNAMINACSKTERKEEAFDTIQKCKSRALLDLLGGKKFDGKREVLTEKEKEEKLLLAKIDTLKEQIEKERERLGQGEITRIERSLKLEESKYEKLKQDISNCREEIKSLENISALDLKDVQKFIEDFTLIEYYATGGKIYACIATKDNFTTIEISCNDLKKKVEQFRNAILQTVALQRGLKLELEEGKEPGPGKEKELSHELYNLLIKPVLPHIKTKVIYISPDNFLNYLPFQALQNEGRYLVEDYAIAYTPSASVLKFCLNKRRENKQKILALGNPNLKDPRFKLVHAEEEVNKIAKQFSESKVFLQDEANEYTVKLLGRDYDILHFACHGQLNAEEPMLSCLRLSPDKENDGYLHAREIFDLNLNASLVTLSACETALGELTIGNEVIGLTRAFLFAGTPSVISTLWNIDDESTSILMSEFYENLKTMSKAEALRKAQISMIKKAKQPYYWSAFCLIGDYM